MPGMIKIYGIYRFICLVILVCISPICTASQMVQDMDSKGFNAQTNKFIFSTKSLSDDLLEIITVESEHLARYDSAKLQQNRIFEKRKDFLTRQSIAKESDEKRVTRIKDSLPADKFVNEVFLVSREYNIDPLLLHAIAEIESHFKPKAISPAGAKGLMQVMPKTARRFGMKGSDTELFDPIKNLRISSNYLRSLHKLFGNNIPLILAAYNAGENAVIKYGYTIPPYGETQMYVAKVMKRYLELKSISYSM